MHMQLEEVAEALAIMGFEVTACGASVEDQDRWLHACGWEGVVGEGVVG